jgi:hypothetical protein
VAPIGRFLDRRLGTEDALYVWRVLCRTAPTPLNLDGVQGWCFGIWKRCAATQHTSEGRLGGLGVVDRVGG